MILFNKLKYYLHFLYLIVKFFYFLSFLFLVADFSQNCIQLQKKTPGKNINNLNTTPVTSSANKLAASKNCGQQLFKELTVENVKKLIQTGRHAFSLDSNSECKQWLINKRRSSIPQEILIESMRNYQ